MPRPRGSKNKSTQSKAATTTARAVNPPKVKVAEATNFVEAIADLEEKIEAASEQITQIFTALMGDVEALKAVPASSGGSTPKVSPKVKAVANKQKPIELDDEDDDEDDDGDDDAVAILEMSVDELEEFIEDNDLDVDLDDYKTLSKKRAAVAEAYAENPDKDEDDDGDDDDDDDDDDGTVDVADDDDDDWEAPAAKPARPARRGSRK